MDTGKLAVNFGSLDTASSDITGSANKIEARLDQLESELAPLRADWTGAASESYQQAKGKWDAAMADIRALLLDIGTTVAASNSDYQSTEGRNTARFA